MVRLAVIVTCLFLAVAVALPSYYDGINTRAQGDALRSQLTELISPHTAITYNQLWSAFAVIDGRGSTASIGCPPGKINDVYSSKCWVSPTEQCGNFKSEGDCFNREHSFPKSWWGGSTTIAAHSDLFHLFPSDGYDNGKRGNFPFGDVNKNTITWRTTSDCLLGKCASSGAPVGTMCWEPSDEWKGVFARAYFYMTVVCTLIYFSQKDILFSYTNVSNRNANRNA